MSQEPQGAVEALDKMYEFEREPVTKDKLQPGRYFAGLFAGEHTAGTEFVIGALFVAWGATAYDILVGLLLGNLMAVLTWAFICAPISTQTRLTLYWYLRKIGGPGTTLVYNIANAIMFCILAGAMITVSASAVREVVGIEPNTHWYPESVGFVLIVLIVGAVVVALAILGFEKLAKFASVCSPWLFLMFIAGAAVSLPYLATQLAQVSEVRSWSDFYALAQELVWTGRTLDGSEPASFWQVAAFAWVCNLAMHGGLSDMALLRYARHWSYGFYSAFGMFLGHYLAWICAGIMGAATALVLAQPLSELDPGSVAGGLLGISGILAVIIAGWTTSNPTLYRAGLAFQAITPGWPRWLVTLIAGAGTTIVACFPFVFTGLLGFVGYYGLLLAPIGAVVVTEHWIFPRIGFQQFYTTRLGRVASWPALLSWVLVMIAAVWLERTGTVNLFYLFLPVYFTTMILYIIFSAIAGATGDVPPLVEEEPSLRAQTAAAKDGIHDTKANRDVIWWISGIIAAACLIFFLVYPIYFFFQETAGVEDWQTRLKTLHNWLIWPTLIYFVAGTIWAVKREPKPTV